MMWEIDDVAAHAMPLTQRATTQQNKLDGGKK